jgi:hypothetical protein
MKFRSQNICRRQANLEQIATGRRHTDEQDELILVGLVRTEIHAKAPN